MGIDTITALVLGYLLVNLAAAAVFAGDKIGAKRSTWRTSESTLLTLAFFGPFGAFIAMQVFRHKTRKVKFWLVPLFLVIHLAVFTYLVLTFL
jgi:uncharacterized membrane protein YsdA (DUF1294 family)